VSFSISRRSWKSAHIDTKRCVRSRLSPGLAAIDRRYSQHHNPRLAAASLMPPTISRQGFGWFPHLQRKIFLGLAWGTTALQGREGSDATSPRNADVIPHSAGLTDRLNVTALAFGTPTHWRRKKVFHIIISRHRKADE